MTHPTIEQARALSPSELGSDHKPPEVTPGPTTDRHLSLGASEIAAVVGLHPYRTALDVWASKVGIGGPPSDPQSIARMSIGTALERPVLRDLYAAPRGLVLTFPGTIPGPEPWMTATPDAMVYKFTSIGVDDPAQRHVAECKIVGWTERDRWQDESQGAAGIPVEVLCQTQWQMLALPAIQHARVVALLGTQLRVYDVPRDDAMIGLLVDLGRQFWRGNVETNKMPPPDGSAASRRIIERRFPHVAAGLLTMTDAIAPLVRQYAMVRDAAAAAKRERDRLANVLCAAVGSAEGFEGDGLRVTWTPQRGRIDWEVEARARGATTDGAARAPDSRVLRVRVGDAETESDE